jgi:hypothetical protein
MSYYDSMAISEIRPCGVSVKKWLNGTSLMQFNAPYTTRLTTSLLATHLAISTMKEPSTPRSTIFEELIWTFHNSLLRNTRACSATKIVGAEVHGGKQSVRSTG